MTESDRKKLLGSSVVLLLVMLAFAGLFLRSLNIHELGAVEIGSAAIVFLSPYLLIWWYASRPSPAE